MIDQIGQCYYKHIKLSFMYLAAATVLFFVWIVFNFLMFVLRLNDLLFVY